MSTPEERQWEMLFRRLDRIENKQDKALTREEFKEFKDEVDEKIEEVEERQEKIQDNVDQLRTAAITPDQVSKMIGDGMNESEARGLTARDRYIRYSLFAISVATFVILLLNRLQGHVG